MDNGVLHDYKQAFCDEPGASNAHTHLNTLTLTDALRKGKRKRDKRENPLRFHLDQSTTLTSHFNQISSEILKTI